MFKECIWQNVLCLRVYVYVCVLRKSKPTLFCHIYNKQDKHMCLCVCINFYACYFQVKILTKNRLFNAAELPACANILSHACELCVLVRFFVWV